MAADSRTRMVESAAALIGSHGMNSTSFAQVLEESGAPRGSIYHHFPRGKEQMAEEAIRWTSEQILSHLAACPEGTPTGILEWFVSLWLYVAETGQGAGGCAVAGVVVDSDVSAEIQTDARAAFGAWTSALATQLRSAGVPQPEADRVALAALAAMEGALILCRVWRSDEPMRQVGQVLTRLIED